jgi:integrase
MTCDIMVIISSLLPDDLRRYRDDRREAMKVLVRDAVASYREEMTSLGLAPNTMSGRTSFLRRFGEACDVVATERGQRGGCGMQAIDPAHVARFFAPLAARSQGCRNNALDALRQFLFWAERMGYLARDEHERILGSRKYKTHTRRPKHYIPASDFASALDIAGDREPGERVTMALAIYTLARTSEIAAIRLSDVDLMKRSLRVYRSKTHRWTEVGICPELYAELRDWLAYYASECGATGPWPMMIEHPDWYLTPRREYQAGRRPSGQFDPPGATYTIQPELAAINQQRIVKRVLTGLGVVLPSGSGPRSVTAVGEGMHTIRRSGARAMLDYLALELGQDKALLHVSVMLDHSDPRVTLAYIGMDIERDQLNDRLRAAPMYGAANSPHTRRATVTQLPALRPDSAPGSLSGSRTEPLSGSPGAPRWPQVPEAL